MKNNFMKKEKGITLIALVVTIIVLLILAGVSIAVLTGENGILNRATEAKKTTEESEVKENIRLAFNNAQIGRYSGEHSVSDYEAFASTMQADLRKTYTGATVTSNGDGTYVATINGKAYDVDENGTPTKQGASIVVGEAVIKDASGNEITTKIQGEGNAYIHFTASLTGGSITGVTVTATDPTNLTTSTPTLTNNEWVTAVSANGTYTFTINGTTEDGNKSTTKSVVVNKFSSVPSGLAIGSIVNYTPTGATHTWSGARATSDNSADISLNSGTDGNAVITSWKVLDIDENENVKLVPASQPSPTLKLQGANGYNNAVKLLNDACKALYTNSTLGIKAENVRNIKVEDIEAAMDKNDAVATAKGTGYPVQMKNANNTYKNGTYGYTSNKNYPLIYANETRAIIDGSSPSGTTINESEQTDFYTGSTSASSGIKPYHTYYSLALNTTNESKSEQAAVLCPTNNNYWVASRCVVTDSNYCNFYVRYVSDSGLYANDLFYSNGNLGNGSRSLFPVVSLSSELLKVDESHSGQYKVSNGN